jgi:hypothetical protein
VNDYFKTVICGISTLIVLMAFTACGTVRGLSNDHAELVAWYIEDVARGTPRNPDELVLPMTTPEMARIASWLAGSKIKDKQVQPRQIDERQKRWSAIHSLFIQGEVVVLSDGLLAPAPALSRADQIYILPVVDAENLDRRSLDALIISMSNSDHDGAKKWVATTAAARLALDTKAGATHWRLPAATNSNPRTQVEQ